MPGNQAPTALLAKPGWRRALIIGAAFLWAGATTAADIRVELRETVFRVGSHLIEGDRGRLYVPENREHADSRTIEIAFLRFRQSAPSPEPPVVYLPGGPGQSVVEHAKDFAATYKNYLNLGGRGDMLVVEQRGIGASRPHLDCPGLLTRPDDQPLSADIMGATHRRYVERCMRHWIEQGADLAGYHVVSMAEDIDDLRASLGYERIKLIGESFGAHHGLALIAKHGDRIERAVLSSVIGPDDMFELPAEVDRRLAMVERRAIDAQRWDRAYAMTPVLGRLDPPIDVRLSTPQGERALTIGRYDLALATVTLARQTGFLQQLPVLYEMVGKGDLSWLAQWSAGMRAGQSMNLASQLITCASGASAGRRSEIARQASDSQFGDVVDLLSAGSCPSVARAAPDGRFDLPASVDLPVLMISGELDIRAPSSNAEAILPRLRRGRHVIFPDVSHDFGNARDAQLELAYRFLARGETDPDPALMPASR
jgi:pimeloyl-ACP methyl ester carboxylesterase